MSTERGWLELVAATAVGAAVSYVVTREISKRYPPKGQVSDGGNSKAVEDNPEERLIQMLEGMDED